MRGLGGSSSIKASRMEEEEREKVLGVGGETNPRSTIAPSSPLIRWGIVADAGLWKYRCKKVCMEAGRRGHTASKNTNTHKRCKLGFTVSCPRHLKPALLSVGEAGGRWRGRGCSHRTSFGRLTSEVRAWIITFFQTMFVNHVIIRHSVTRPYL